MRTRPALLALGSLLALAACDDDTDPAPDAAPPPLAATLEAGLAAVDGLEPALLGVWGAAADAVWFAGGTAEPEGGALYRFDGARVAPEPAPPGPLLWWVWGADAERVWACGEGGRVLRRGADGWVAEETGLDEKAVLWGLWGSGPDDLWAVGGSVRRGGPKGVVLRSAGDGVWTRVDDPALPAELNLYKAWGSGPDDVWLVGEGTVTVHWDGVGFTRADLGQRDLLFTVHGRAGGPVIAVGGVGSGLVYALGAGGWVAEDPAGVIGLNGVAVRPDGLALASGARGALVLRDLAGRWFRLRPQPDAVGARTLHAVWHGPDDSTWAVGGDLSAVADGVILTDRRPLPRLAEP